MRLCRIDPATGAATPIYAAEARDVEAWSASPDGTMLATIENDRGYARLRLGPMGGARPELAGLPDLFIHRPWDAPPLALASAKVALGRDYPLPVVDHGAARRRALAAYQQVRGAA